MIDQTEQPSEINSETYIMIMNHYKSTFDLITDFKKEIKEDNSKTQYELSELKSQVASLREERAKEFGEFRILNNSLEKILGNGKPGEIFHIEKEIEELRSQIEESKEQVDVKLGACADKHARQIEPIKKDNDKDHKMYDRLLVFIYVILFLGIFLMGAYKGGPLLDLLRKMVI